MIDVDWLAPRLIALTVALMPFTVAVSIGFIISRVNTRKNETRYEYCNKYDYWRKIKNGKNKK